MIWVRALAAVVLALSLFVGAASARSCGKDVLADWKGDGKLDRSWSCACLLDALTLPPDEGASQLPARNAIERQLRVQCTGWVGVSQPEPERTVGSSAAAEVGLGVYGGFSSVSSERGDDEFTSAAVDAGGSVGDDAILPWGVAITGIVAGGLVVLLGAAALRPRRRLRP